MSWPPCRGRPRLRAATTRAATDADDSGSGPPSKAAGLGWGIATHRSIRSRSGPDTRCWYRSTVGPVHEQRPSGSDPANPHGHGFIAATSWNRHGNVVVRPARAMTTRPSSSGCRSASRTSRSNSGSSSRKEHPAVGTGDLARARGPDRRRPSPRTTACGAAIGMAVVVAGRGSVPRRRPRPRPSPRARPHRRGRAGASGSSARAGSCRRPAARTAADRGRRPGRSPRPVAPGPWPRTSARSGGAGRITCHCAPVPRSSAAVAGMLRPGDRHPRTGDRPATRSAAPQRIHGLGQAAHTGHVHAVDEVRLGDGLRRHDDARDARARAGPRPSAGCRARSGPRHRATARR